MTAKLRRREPLTAGEFERAKRMTRKLLKATLPDRRFHTSSQAIAHSAETSIERRTSCSTTQLPSYARSFQISLHVAAHTDS